MKKQIILKFSLLAFCFLLPGCEGLDPSMLAGLQGGGNQRGYNEPPRGYGGGNDYDRGYSGRPDYSRDSSYGRTQERPYYGSDRDYRQSDNRYDDHDSHRSGSGSSSKNKDYFGGPQEWYKSGYALGKKDRKERHSSNYRRHNTQYDGKTQSQFAAGYQDGYGR